jgi:hypothetical protein
MLSIGPKSIDLSNTRPGKMSVMNGIPEVSPHGTDQAESGTGQMRRVVPIEPQIGGTSWPIYDGADNRVIWQ